MGVIFEHLKQSTTPEMVRKIEETTSPSIAADLISEYGPHQACALLDSMSPLGAAFILLVLRTRVRDDKRAEEIVDLVKTLQLRATRGLTEAREETYRRTGVFLP